MQPGTVSTSAAALAAVKQRLTEIDDALVAWSSAHDLTAVRRSAETVRSLVAGDAFPGPGPDDADARGAHGVGLLPGPGGEPGLVTAVAGTCLEAQVLGGPWGDPEARWDELRAAVADWAPDNNTFPALASHPQRVVGWASLALVAPELADAVGYADHARLHLGVTRAAVDAC